MAVRRLNLRNIFLYISIYVYVRQQPAIQLEMYDKNRQQEACEEQGVNLLRRVIYMDNFDKK